jgi:signal recognition particle subunit SRP19
VSPAMTGGGVSENLFKDMMKEMQGGSDPMAALQNAAGRAVTGGGSGGAAAEEKKGKKDKKGKGKA